MRWLGLLSRMALARPLYGFGTIMQLKTPAYLLQPRKYELETVVAGQEGGLTEFEDSIFHLQGGGQPNDKGWVEALGQKFEVAGGTVDRETGRLRYKLAGQPELPAGTPVRMAIDPALRDMHAKVHSAGHLIDLAVTRLKYDWVPGKGYHFLDGPYVEYKGVAAQPEKAAAELNEALGAILAQKIEASNKVLGWGEAVQQGLIGEDFKVAWVRVVGFGEASCPCGGTHVGNSGDIASIVVSKVQKKGKNVRVMYRVEQ